jgi:glycosyltransferase involved in cell wall biosynthesis
MNGSNAILVNLLYMTIGSQSPFISVCIPAYKHNAYIERLLNSLSDQTFTQFEVIITDDSPDESVSNVVAGFSSTLNLRYFKNKPALGTPENWNESIRHAKGKWIKLIHDDDWLSSNTSLQDYVEAINRNPGVEFFFSAYQNIQVNAGKDIRTLIKPELFRIKQLQQNPVSLLSKNIIGPPSVVIHRNDQNLFYDKNLKWLVDMDFYMRYLDKRIAVYIDKPLINIGLNEQQVTRSSSLVREVEIPEHFRILQKTGVQQLENLLVYDAWWRLMRNLRIRDLNEIKMAGYNGDIPDTIVKLIKFQQIFPYIMLKFGPASKALMLASYIQNKLRN